MLASCLMSGKLTFGISVAAELVSYLQIQPGMPGSASITGFLSNGFSDSA